MIIYISGSHTAPYGDFPYNKGEEFARALKREWDAIDYFKFYTIDGAEIILKKKKIINLTVQEVYSKLNEAVKNASKKCLWEIWHEA